MFELFKKPEYRRFNLQPRYWDPEKEAREEREKRIKAELGLKEDSDQYIPNIKGQLRKEFMRRKADRNSNSLFKNRSVRIFMILVMLLIGGFWLYSANKEGILRFFGM